MLLPPKYTKLFNNNSKRILSNYAKLFSQNPTNTANAPPILLPPPYPLPPCVHTTFPNFSNSAHQNNTSSQNSNNNFPTISSPTGKLT